jgi:hypothetical protein
LFRGFYLRPDPAAGDWLAASALPKKPRAAVPKVQEINDRSHDLAFLAAHPVRRSNSEAMDIAASRDLSDEEIKPVLTLKHHEIVEFTEKHGVNVEWMLEGKGRIFKKDPIRLSSNSTGAEFAAVVATMPMADQQAIRTMVREIARERDQ